MRVDVTDTGEEFWVRFGIFSGTDPDSGTTYADEEDFHVVDAPEDPEVEPDVVVDGTAAALDLWLWSRGGDDGPVGGRATRTCSTGSARSSGRRSTEPMTCRPMTRADDLGRPAGRRAARQPIRSEQRLPMHSRHLGKGPR